MKKTIELKGPQVRVATFDRATVNMDDRTVELSFSSETTDVERWFGVEILGHGPGEVRLGRLNAKAPLLMDHNFRDQIGVVEKAWIDAGTKKGRALVRFSKSDRGGEILQDVQDGIRCNVSTTYDVHRFALESEGSGGSPDVYRAIDWEPYEISIVSVPADTSVGIGRNHNPDTPARSVEVVNNRRDEGGDMGKCTSCGDELVNGACPKGCGGRSVVPPVVTVNAGDILATERQRIAEIGAIASAFGHVDGVADMARSAIAEGQDLGTFQGAILQKMRVKPPTLPDPSGVNLSGKEERKYSIRRGIMAQIGEGEAGFEREIHAELEAKIGRPSRGLLVPLSLKSRAATTANTATGASGGYLVATETGPMIELLRNQMYLRRLGARVLSGLVGNVSFPRQIASAVLTWVAQNSGSNVSDSDLAAFLGQVTLSPKSAASSISFTRELLTQSSEDCEMLTRDDLTAVNALGLDYAGVAGTGSSNQPRGILNTTGIGSVALGDYGATPTFASMVALETAVALANADLGSIAYLTSVQARGYLKTLPKFTNSSIPVWEKGSEAGYGEVNGYRAAATNQVPSDLTKGYATGLSAAIFGNFNDLLIGEFGVLELIVDPYSLKKQGLIEVTSYMLCDVACRRPASFAAIKDMKTS